MKYNIVFSSGEVDLFGTNTQDTISLVDYLKDPSIKIISYTLNDLPLTQKFIEYYKIYRDEHVKYNKTHTHLYSYNYYIGNGYGNIVLAKKEMNKIIEQLITVYNYNIDKNLKLIEDAKIIEHNKYNSLHFIFEVERKKLNDAGIDLTDQRIILFEKINHIVHFLENGISNDFYALVIRPNLFVPRYQLENEDYENFSFPEPGDLICDFATVGKDLWDCSRSNDIELIKNNSVNQQIHLTDYVKIEFRNKNKPKIKELYYDWCKKNKIDRYLDISLPKYKPGRHILGKIDQPIYSAEDFYKEIYSKTPKMIGSYLSDNTGNPILKEYL